MDIRDKFTPIRKGLLELAVLQVIAAHKVYAADILRLLSESEFATQEGTLYPLLSRLKRERLVEYEWVESDAGPPRKYYHLTDDGKRQLHDLQSYLRTLEQALEHIGASNA